jgi:hypothetical protein
MAIKAKVDAAWANNLMQDATFECRAEMERAYIQLGESISKINAIIARASFAGVDAEIKAEGVAIKTLLTTCKTGLDTHTAFLLWRQP